jgi:hypothetical protein
MCYACRGVGSTGLSTFLVAGPKASVAHAWRPSSELMMELFPAPDSPSSMTVQVNGRSASGPEAACLHKQAHRQSDWHKSQCKKWTTNVRYPPKRQDVAVSPTKP